MNAQQNIAFKSLLHDWNRHQDLRDTGAPIADLAKSRADLDAARLACARALYRLAA